MKKIIIVLDEKNRQKTKLTILLDSFEIPKQNMVKKRSTLDYWI